MKRYTLLMSFLIGSFATVSFGQTNTLPQSASTTESLQSAPTPPTMNKGDEQRRLQQKIAQDTTRPKKRDPKRLRPDSLRRGGATRIDTIR